MLSLEVAILKMRALNPYKKSEGLPRREAQLIEVKGKRATSEAIQRLQQAPATNHAQRHAMGVAVMTLARWHHQRIKGNAGSLHSTYFDWSEADKL